MASEVTKTMEDGRFFCAHNHIKVNMNLTFLFIYPFEFLKCVQTDSV